MKNIVKHYWLALGLIFMMLMTGYYIIKNQKEVIKKRNTADLLPHYALKLQNVHYAHNDPDKDIKWELDAKKVIFYKDRSIDFFDFHLGLHSRNKKEFELKGRKGKYKKNENMLYLKGNIRAIYAGSYRLYTDSMIFNENTGQGRTSDPVKIKGPFFHINGTGMWLDIKKKKIKVLSNVRSIIYKNF